MPIKIGTREAWPMEQMAFGRYQLLSLIGEGGMGKVYRARDTVIDRDVAVKVLSGGLSAEPGYRERFRREAHTAARLAEPHIIPIFDTGEVDGQLYLVMPVVDGLDVQALLTRDGPMSPERAVNVTEQLAAALSAAHAVGLVHRDVKPSNALLTGRDFTYLIDFGIAHDSAATKLTHTGMILGSWAYMAPERFTTGTVESSADVYGLTCVLYECLTGVQPYPGNSLEQQIASHLSLEPPRPSNHDPAIPTGFGEVIAHGMAKDPLARYPSAIDLASAARHALTTDPVRPIPDAPRRLTRAAPAPTLLRATRPPPGNGFRPTPPAPGPALGTTPAATGPIRLDPSQPPPAPSVPHDRIRPAAGRPHPVDIPPEPARGRHRLRWAVVAAIVVILAAGGLGAYLARTPEASTAQSITAPEPSALAISGNLNPAASAVPTTGRPASTPEEANVLPFTGLNGPTAIAADDAGNVYVADSANDRVLELAAGSNAPTSMPFTGLANPGGIAVDARGALYVTNTANGQVFELARGSSGTTELPFPGLSAPRGVAVDAAGDLYVADGSNRILKLPAGSSSPVVPPFSGLNNPTGVAVDSAGAVYVADSGNDRVLKLPANAAAATVVPLVGLSHPDGVAVDHDGNVYVADRGNDRILELAAGSTTPTVLPFSRLNGPTGAAVDTAGTVFVTDSGNDRVVTSTVH